MKATVLLVMSWLAGIAAAAPPAAPVSRSAENVPAVQHLHHGRFRNLRVFRPAGPVHGVLLLLSGEFGWKGSTNRLARQLQQQGNLVVGIDWRALRRNLEADDADCVFPDGDLENLSHFVQAYVHLPTYLPPVLMGEAAGATLAYAVLAQSPKDTFAGALTLDFCPWVHLQKPLCKGSGLVSRRQGPRMEFLPSTTMSDPWINLDTDAPSACSVESVNRFMAKVPGAQQLQVKHPPPGVREWPILESELQKITASAPAKPLALPPAALGNLPVVEIPPKIATSTDRFALILSGDGGWAGLDEEVAAALSARGIPVVGLDSLRYFWTPRTPDGVSADIDRIIRYYLTRLGKQNVLLIGYSQGADVLPFAINRLPAATRARIALSVLIGMSDNAQFEFHLTQWIADSKSGLPTLPEVDRVPPTPLLCIYGEDEDDSLCPRLDPRRFRVVRLKGGHHFNGDYAGLAREILSVAGP